MRNRLIIAGVLLLLVLAYLYLWFSRPTAEPEDPLSFEPEKSKPAKPEAAPRPKKPAKKKPLDLTLPPSEPSFGDGHDNSAEAFRDKLPGLSLPGTESEDPVELGPQFDFNAKPEGGGFGTRQWEGQRFSLESGSEVVDDVGEEKKRDQAVGVGVSVDF